MKELSLFEAITLVFANDTKTESYTTTRAIAKFLDLDHSYIKKKLRKMIEKSDLIRDRVSRINYKDIRNRTQTEYKISKDASLRFIIEFETKDAHEIKDTLVLEFMSMSKYLSTVPEWNKTRLASKEENKNTQKVLDDFILYAEKQRGRSYNDKCPYRYKFHQLIAKSVLGANKSDRDTLPRAYIHIIEQLEYKLRDLLITFMCLGCEYHDIYKHVTRHLKEGAKDGLEAYSLPVYADG